MKPTITTFIVFALLSTGKIRAQSIAERLDSLFTSPGNFEQLNGGVLVAIDGKVVYEKGFGYSNFERKIPNTIYSSFPIASNTKVFTSISVLQLRDKGRLNLDDAFVKYFPEFPFNNITIRNLLTHTSGLPNVGIYYDWLKDDSGKRFGMNDIIPAIVKYGKSLRFQPGEKFEYSNINYELLALMVEKLSALSFQAYVRKYIFIPAGMTHSYFANAGDMKSDANLVRGYTTVPGRMYMMPVNTDSLKDVRLRQMLDNLIPGLTGDGGIISTLDDMLNFDNALSSGRLLKVSSLKEAYTSNRLTNGKDYTLFPNPVYGIKHYGLGWIVDQDSSNGLIVSHRGGDPGTNSGFVRNITKKQTIIIYDNTEWGSLERLVMMATDILNNKPVRHLLPKKSLAILYGQTLVANGPDDALAKLFEFKNDTAHYNLDEYAMNQLGYDLLFNHYKNLALETFKINVLLFPTSFNVYDSYADALGSNGNKDAATTMYKKSIELNPNNEGGKKKLQNILKSQ